LTITVSESIRLVLGILEITPTGPVLDTITVLESIATGVLVIVQTEAITIAEAIISKVAFLVVDISDSVTVVDTLAITLTFAPPEGFSPVFFRRNNTLLRM